MRIFPLRAYRASARPRLSPSHPSVITQRTYKGAAALVVVAIEVARRAARQGNGRRPKVRVPSWLPIEGPL
jgi:hypothetical protein